MHGDIYVTLKTENGWTVLPSSLKRSDGAPRFNMSFPAFYVDDVGARYLVARETSDGYEVPTRNLIERLLQRGDLLVDIGAHWGFFTLQAATHPAGEIAAIAFEPELMNAMILTENIVKNSLSKAATVVCAACGHQYEMAPLATNSTMGHSVRGVGLPEASRGPPKWVAVVPLDAALASLPQHAGRRIVLKIDAEGFEPNVVAGAAALLGGGRVAAIIWECAHAASSEQGRRTMTAMTTFLSGYGFRHFRPLDHEVEGPLITFDAGQPGYAGNVFSFAPQLTAALQV